MLFSKPFQTNEERDEFLTSKFEALQTYLWETHLLAREFGSLMNLQVDLASKDLFVRWMSLSQFQKNLQVDLMDDQFQNSGLEKMRGPFGRLILAPKEIID